MKLITLECPNCNASLQVNEELSEAQCNYCGKHFVIDREMLRNAKQDGYDFEKGRMEAAETSSEELARRIKAVKEPLDRIYDLNDELEDLEWKRKNLDEGYASYSKYCSFFNSPFGKNIAFVSLDIILLIVVCVRFMNGMRASTMLGWLVFGIISALALILVAGIFHWREDNYFKSLDKMDQKIGAVKDEMADVEDSTDIGFIPEKYRHREAINFIYDSARRKRANTMQQAINLYEDKLQRDELERVRQQQFDEMKEYYEQQLDETRKQTAALKKLNKRPTERIVERNTVYVEKEDEGNSTLQAISTAGGLIVAGSMIAKAIKKGLK